jgi:hypothetical protein
VAQLFDKYVIAHGDGTPVDPQAHYLVLRLDRPENEAERWAARTFALFLKDRELAGQIIGAINRITADVRAEFVISAMGRYAGIVRGV